MYEPTPIDTSGIELPAELLELTEKLAENNHDLWPQKRIFEGWTNGLSAPIQRKTHPDLVPYAELHKSVRKL